jgi:hypothetical protein
MRHDPGLAASPPVRYHPALGRHQPPGGLVPGWPGPRPSLVIAKLQALQRHNPLQRAIQELGCLAKTRHILSYIDDSQLRRRILVGLNKQERLHGLGV